MHQITTMYFCIFNYKKYLYVHSIPVNRQTNRQTDRRTDEQIRISTVDILLGTCSQFPIHQFFGSGFCNHQPMAFLGHSVGNFQEFSQRRMLPAERAQAHLSQLRGLEGDQNACLWWDPTQVRYGLILMTSKTELMQVISEAKHNMSFFGYPCLSMPIPSSL